MAFARDGWRDANALWSSCVMRPINSYRTCSDAHNIEFSRIQQKRIRFDTIHQVSVVIRYRSDNHSFSNSQSLLCGMRIIKNRLKPTTNSKMETITALQTGTLDLSKWVMSSIDKATVENAQQAISLTVIIVNFDHTCWWQLQLFQIGMCMISAIFLQIAADLKLQFISKNLWQCTLNLSTSIKSDVSSNFCMQCTFAVSEPEITCYLHTCLFVCSNIVRCKWVTKLHYPKFEQFAKVLLIAVHILLSPLWLLGRVITKPVLVCSLALVT